LLTRILIFTNYYKGFNPTDIVRHPGDSFLKSTRADFNTGMKITHNQQFSMIRKQGNFDPTDAAGDGDVLW